MELIAMKLIPFCWYMAIAGWIWLIVLGFRDKGWFTALLFVLVGFFAMVYGYRQWRDPKSLVKTGIPLLMFVGGLSLVLLLVVLVSTL